MARLADIIRTRHAEIVQLWTDEARRAAGARGLAHPEFQNLMPAYLSSLAEAGNDLGRFGPERRRQVEGHLSSRVRE